MTTQLNDKEIEPSPLLEFSPTSNALLMDSLLTTPAITFLSPGDDDDAEDEDGDWSDVDDEDFEDMAEDKDDFHEMELENDIFDDEDDDHLPDDDF
jgi:hypothetical protein